MFIVSGSGGVKNNDNNFIGLENYGINKSTAKTPKGLSM